MRSRTERGVVLYIVVGGMVALLGMSGLGVDVSYLRHIRHVQQIAADSAALAGAGQLEYGDTVNGAAAAATQNGFTDNSSSVQPSAVGYTTVSVTCSSSLTGTYGTSCGTPGTPDPGTYVEVAITRNQPVFFMSVFGLKEVPITAMAVGYMSTGQGCVYALDPNNTSSTFLASGDSTVAINCGVIDYSSSTSAMTITGNSNFSAGFLAVTGGTNISGNSNMTPATASKGIKPGYDPLAYEKANEPTPATGTCTVSGGASYSGKSTLVTITAGYCGAVSATGNSGGVTVDSGVYGNGLTLQSNSSAAVTLSPSGVYYGGVTISGNSSVTLSPGTYYGGLSVTGNSNVYLQSGTYIIVGGGLTVTGNSNISQTGSGGVSFYITYNSTYAYKPVNFSGNSNTTLSAPTSGALAGMMFFQDPSVPATTSSSMASTVTGNSTDTFSGAIYFPTTSLTFCGDSATTGGAYLVAYTITISGSSTTDIGSGPAGLSPIKDPVLVE